ncbi:MFS transporter [Phyllobacterium sp. 22229]|uniref:Alpha-ketoglutarate permease n=1 Tax=Phyllobacterium myrsinacearum TaxID=28101 RepID=A0A2S9JJP4_9HYPH|nr:MFS transporter [Phyllobacterium myrsinacearum]PRD53331.1 alpha-ketoglutarate permease [Phyllobacterium myrsinacearum]PWV87664.1 MHS family alpha-ketoglutarate permease-like MFS transporter [Phyllobacterium myrsinacearum]RZS82254.1 MHS family alpha-ketoglutarate permease-like MFS transporter [Phyllobacterium myrsinacearum]RZV07761.1 MHS family alpha-ketoglutarate permease-like MFS transporter [Phyllobacterium myrsinacearum]
MSDIAETAPIAVAPDVKTRLKSIIGGSAGNLVEWYDWYVYAAFTLYFAPVFFPSGNQTAELLSAAAVFAVGFLMRPIGAWVMGIYADRKGRKAGLTLSVTLMCLGSLLIAITPGYATIGLLAPTLLVIARLLQGLSVGGEYGASATYLSEMAGKNRRGFYSSFQYVTLISGQLVALVVLLILQRILTPEQLGAWGWRIPFAIGGFLAIAVFYIRRGLAETQSFHNAKNDDKPKSSGFALFRHYPKEAFTVLALTSGGTLAFYAYTTYLQKFLVNTSGFSKESSSEITALALLIFMLCQPIAGALSDRIGRKPLMVGFGILGVLFTYLIFSTLAVTTSPYVAFALSLAGLLIVTGYTSINAVVKAELFPAHIRALGVALPYALANTIFGGTAEWVALKFKQMGHETWFFWYVTIMIGLSLIVYIKMRDSRDHSLIHED